MYMKWLHAFHDMTDKVIMECMVAPNILWSWQFAVGRYDYVIQSLYTSKWTSLMHAVFFMIIIINCKLQILQMAIASIKGHTYTTIKHYWYYALMVYITTWKWYSLDRVLQICCMFLKQLASYCVLIKSASRMQ